MPRKPICLYLVNNSKALRTLPTLSTEDKSSSSSKKKSGGSSSSSKGGLRAEMEGLRAHLDTTNSDRTPLSGETLRQFYRWAGNVYLLVCLV